MRFRVPLTVVALSLLAVFSTVAFASTDASSEFPGQTRQTEADPVPGPDESQIVVYYFHGNKRCKTCRTIESYTQETLESWFAEDLRAGRVQWQPINFDQAENEHYIEDFELPSSSLVVAEVRDGKVVRSQILDRVWMLTGDEDKFSSYVRVAVLDYLK